MEDEVTEELGVRPSAKIERIRFLKVPVDIIQPDDLGLWVFDMAGKQVGRHVVLLSLMDLLRARRNTDYRRYVEQAALVVPISKSIVNGARFLLGKRPVRYMPFDFVIKCMSALEEHEYSCYLLGNRKRVLSKIERNINSTFPRLRIVGRFPGYFRRQSEEPVISAIRKASPSLLLVSKGVRGGERWVAKNSRRLGNGLKLWCSDLFDVLVGRKWRPSRRVFELGLEWAGYCLRNPVRILRIFPYTYYLLLLLAQKLFVKQKPEAEKPMRYLSGTR